MAAICAYLATASGNASADCLVHVYQSQFGYQPWLGPTLNNAAAAFPLPVTDPRKRTFSELHGNAAVLTNICFAIAPGFAADCVETLSEIKWEAGEVFESCGGHEFIYVPCLNDSDAHVSALLSVLQL
ncbi:Ferrochelatase [Novymonas esmeraldas]|uniref:Ferrochelatase n=1 Tax=Novymonas esmeraldas TaxID=1808958 RepID=A0AAW0EWD2_9TRYP